MVDISDDPKRVRRRVEVRSGVIRRRRWTDEEKGRIVGEAVKPGAVIAEAARRHDMTPQHLSNWIRAAKDGRLALRTDEDVTFVPIIAPGAISVGPPAASHPPAMPIEIVFGSVVVRVANGADAATLQAVMRAVKRAAA
jgi:transposase